jgi:hypothetical protein
LEKNKRHHYKDSHKLRKIYKHYQPRSVQPRHNIKTRLSKTSGLQKLCAPHKAKHAPYSTPHLKNLHNSQPKNMKLPTRKIEVQ